MLSSFSHVRLFNPLNCSPPGSSVHGILQARILKWGATSFSRGSSWPRNQTCIPLFGRWFFTTEPSGKPMSCVLSKSKFLKLIHASKMNFFSYVFPPLCLFLWVVPIFIFGHVRQLTESQFPNQELNLGPQQWKLCIPTTDHQGISSTFCLTKWLSGLKRKLDQYFQILV